MWCSCRRRNLIETIKRIRNDTACSLSLAKQAAVYSQDYNKALDFIRAEQNKKAQKVQLNQQAGSGLLVAWAHERQAGIVHWSCLTDFVARNNLYRDYVVRGTEAIRHARSIELEEMLKQATAALGENVRMADSYIHTGHAGIFVHASHGAQSVGEYKLGTEVAMVMDNGVETAQRNSNLDSNSFSLSLKEMARLAMLHQIESDQIQELWKVDVDGKAYGDVLEERGVKVEDLHLKRWKINR